jgi:hypothetical protein
MNRIVIVVLVFVTIVVYNCTKEIHHDLSIQNKSSKTIIASFGDYFPDTTLRCGQAYSQIAINEEYTLFLRNGWENELNRIKYFQIFILDSAVYKTYPCDTIKKYNIILKHYQLTLEDIENLNWVISYP